MRLHASASLATVIHMAIEGLGIAVIPTAIVENEMADGRLQLLSTNLQIPLLTFSASWLASPDTVAVERVAELAASLAQAASLLTRRCRRVIETDRVKRTRTGTAHDQNRIQSANRFRPAVGHHSRNREIRRHAQRRRAAADARARGQAGARLVPQGVRGRRPRGACRCARLDVRPAQGPRHVEAAGRARLAPRYPADRRQVRRRARHAGGARGGAHAQRCRDRDRNADLHLSTGPTRKARALRRR
jgi:hypothetical protein